MSWTKGFWRSFTSPIQLRNAGGGGLGESLLSLEATGFIIKDEDPGGTTLLIFAMDLTS